MLFLSLRTNDERYHLGIEASAGGVPGWLDPWYQGSMTLRPKAFFFFSLENRIRDAE